MSPPSQAPERGSPRGKVQSSWLARPEEEARSSQVGRPLGARGHGADRTGGSGGTCRGTGRPEAVTAPPGPPQPGPPATIWKCGTCKTSPSHAPGGISGTASCRLETGELWPQALPGPAEPGRATRTPAPEVGQIRGTGRAQGLPGWKSHGGISRQQQRGLPDKNRTVCVKSPHRCLTQGELSRPLKGFATLPDSPWGL